MEASNTILGIPFVLAISLALDAATIALILAWREIRRLRRRLEVTHAEARTDPLTGIGNRRSWDEQVGELVEVGQPFSFVLFDVANLKAINAALGHFQADEVLRSIAQQVRSGDMVGHRIGGDEFAVALPGTPAVGAAALRDRIEEQVGLAEIAPDVLGFLVGATGEWRPGDDLIERLTATDFDLEARKAERKTVLGLPLTRGETLAKVSA